MNLDALLPDLVEFGTPLVRGVRIGRPPLRVFEVRRLRSTCALAGAPRALYVAVHEKDWRGSMLTLFVVLAGKQTEWCVDSPTPTRKRRMN